MQAEVMDTRSRLKVAREVMDDAPTAESETIYGQYLAAYDRLTADGSYPYNDRFIGQIPAIAGHDAEGSFIYLCQCRRRDNERQAQIAEDRKAGAKLVVGGMVTDDRAVPFARVIHYNYSSSTRREYEKARVLFRKGEPYGILPKGKRTNGYHISPYDYVLGVPA